MPWNQKSVLLRLRSVAFLLAIALCLSCSGDDDSGPGPTAPPQEFLLAIGGGFTNLDCPCLHDFEVLFDGRVLSEFRNPNALQVAVWAVTPRAPRGQHQVAIRLTRQTSTASEYFAFGNLQVFNVAGGQVVDLELEDRAATLRAGESVSWTFTF